MRDFGNLQLVAAVRHVYLQRPPGGLILIYGTLTVRVSFSIRRTGTVMVRSDVPTSTSAQLTLYSGQRPGSTSTSRSGGLVRD
jgi:hypothetical protein